MSFVTLYLLVVAGLLFAPVSVPGASAHATYVAGGQWPDTADTNVETHPFTTVAGPDRILIVAVHHLDQSGPATGATATVNYGGTAMTCPNEARSQATIVAGRRLLVASQLCYLVAPPVGTANIVVTWSAIVVTNVVLAVEYTKVDQLNPVGAMGNLENVGSTVSLPITTGQRDSLIVASANAKTFDGTTFTNLAGTTTRTSPAAGTPSATPSSVDDILVVGGDAQANFPGSYTAGWNLVIPGGGGFVPSPKDMSVVAMELNTDPYAQFQTTSGSGWESVLNPVINVTLDHGYGGNVQVNYSVTGGTATGGGVDFTLTGTSLNFTCSATPCTTVKKLPLTIVDDALIEPDETIVITLTGSTAHLGTNRVYTYTIKDDDVGLHFRVDGDSGDEGLANPSVLVDLDRAWITNVTVGYSLVLPGRTATPGGVDYTLATGTLDFPPGNRTQRIPLVIAEDTLDEPDENLTIKLGTPPLANVHPLRPTRFNYTILDNDGPPVVAFGADTSQSESVPTALLPVTLDVPSGKTVTVPYSVTGGTAMGGGVDYTLASGTVVFPPGTTARTISVAIVSDRFDESDETVQVTLGSPTNATRGDAVLVHTIVDDDTAMVLVDVANVTVSEPGTSAVFHVRLNSTPTQPVTITITAPGGKATLSPTVLTFTAANWNVNQTVTVTAVDDWIAQGTHVEDLLFAVSSGDATYNGMGLTPVRVFILDDDVAGVRISPTSVAVAEGGATDSYTVVLTSEPTAPVTVHVAPDGQVLANGMPGGVDLVFTPTDWNQTQTVTVAAVDDPDHETTPHAGSLTHTAASSDLVYDAMPVATVTASIQDNDVPGLRMDKAALDVWELGTTVDTYHVTLGSRPSGDVDVTLNLGSQAELSVGGSPWAASATFRILRADWATPVTVSVRAIDDGVTEADPHPDFVTHTMASSDPDYTSGAAGSVLVRVHDDDIPGIDLAESAPDTSVDENGAGDAYTVRLHTQPPVGATVTIRISAGPSLTVDDGRGGGPRLTLDLNFDSTTWNRPQTIAVAAVNDDVAGATPRTVTLRHTGISATDPYYDGLVRNLAVTVNDDDVAGVRVAPTTVAVTEGPTPGTQDYGVALTSQPLQPVTITVQPGPFVSVSPASLTFTAANWNRIQYVTVTPLNDRIANGDATGHHPETVAHSAASSDPSYSLIPVGSVAVDILDDDRADVLVSKPALDLAEPAGTDRFTVRLASQPKSAVHVDLTPQPDGTGAVHVSLSVTSLTFTPSNWNVARTVDATTLDDDVDQPDDAGPGRYASAIDVTTDRSADATYRALTPPPLPIAIVDDDTAAVLVSTSSAAVSETGPSSASYTIALATRPAGPVTVDLTVPGGQASIAPASWTFTPAAHGPHTFTVTAIDDDLDEASPHADAIHHAVRGGSDPVYAALTIADVTLSITDNDAAGYLVSKASVTATEGSPADTFTVRLTSQPTGPVHLDLAAGARTVLGAATLDFGTARGVGGWDTPQTVTVGAFDDRIQQASPASDTLTFSATTADGQYATAPTALAITLVDDDRAALVLSESSGQTVAREGVTDPLAMDTVTVTLATVPAYDVTVTLTPDAQVELSTDGGATWGAPVLVFAAGADPAPTTVLVHAIDDAAAEGVHFGHVLASLSTADAFYAALPSRDVPVRVTDNDSPGVDVTEAAGTTAVAEAGATTDTFDVVLVTRPTADVTVTVAAAPAGQVTFAPASLVFTPATWDVPQTVTVRAIDDAVAEGPHTARLSTVSSSGDPDYVNLAGADVVAAITDDDSAGLVITPGTLTVAEGGGTQPLHVRLTSQPTADVTVTLAATTGQAGVTGAVLRFTPVDWSTPQDAGIGAIDDLVAEDPPQTDSITASASSGDPFYQGLAGRATPVTVTDNDAAGVVPSTSGPITLSEDGTPVSLTVVLASQPTADVKVTATIPGAAANVAPGQLTFTPLDWSTPKTLTLQGIHDFVAQGTHGDDLRLTVASTDPIYARQTVPDLPLRITDIDTPGILIATSGSGAGVTEGGANDSYRISLSSRPTSPVTLTITPDGQATTTPTQVTLDAASWWSGVAVRVDAVDDDVAEGGHTTRLAHRATSPDATYDGRTVALVLPVVDNDVAAVRLVESGGVTRATEGGRTDSFTLALATTPAAPVTVTVTADAQTEVDTGSGWSGSGLVTLTAADHGPHTVLVRAADDAVVEGNHAGRLRFSLAGDAAYASLAVPDLVVQIVDNDAPGISLYESLDDTTVAEAGATSDAYEVVLTTPPAASVVVRMTLGAAGQFTLDQTALTFTAADWNVPQTVTVTAVDDAVIEPAQTVAIHHASYSSDYWYDSSLAVGDVLVHVQDDDVPGLRLVQTAGDTQVSEGGASDQVTVSLTSQPAANVVLHVDTDGEVDAGADLTFSPTTWNRPQTVTVRAVDDARHEATPHAGSVQYTASSTDESYDGLSVAFPVQVADNDVVQLLVSPTPALVTEGGGADVLDVQLATQPVANVVVDLQPDAQVTVAPAQLTFTPTNWNVPQALRVRAVDDLVAEATPHAGAVDLVPSTADPDYALAGLTLTVRITDNDAPGILVKESGRATDLSESGGQDTYTVELTTQPTATVTVTVTPDAQVTVDSTTLTFGPLDWNVPKAVTVRAVDDAVQEGAHTGRIQHAATSPDASYDALPVADVVANLADNDLAALLVLQPGGTTDVAEGGASDTYTVALATVPTAPVTVSLTPDAQVTVSPGSLTFLPGTWSTPQQVTVTAVDDAAVEGTHTGLVTNTAASPDGFYAALPPITVAVGITDNDAPGIFVAETASATAVSENGATTDTYTLVLTRAPASNVTVAMSWDATQLTVGPATLTFTASNWMVAQTVAVQAVDDAYVEAPLVSSIHHAVTGAAGFAGLAVRDVAVAVADDDAAGLVLVESLGLTAVTEGGAGDTVSVTLASRPAAPVTIALTVGAQTRADAASLTFTPADWNVAQVVTVTAVDDLQDEPDPLADVLRLVAASADADYDGANATVAIAVHDDDAPPTIAFATSATNALEDLGAVQGLVRLSRPSGREIRVDLVDLGSGTATSGSDYGPVATTLVFPPGAVNATYDLDVVPDTLTEPDETVRLALLNPVNATLGAALLTHTITTDDQPGILVVDPDGITFTVEDGATDTIYVSLAAPPGGTVTVTVTSRLSGQLATDVSALVFTPGDWSTGKAVVLSALADGYADGDVLAFLDFAVAPGSAAEYLGVTDAYPTLVKDRIAFVLPPAASPPGRGPERGGGITLGEVELVAPPPQTSTTPPPVIVLHSSPGDFDVTDHLDFRYDGHARLSWSPVPGATGYALWRQTPAGTWQLAAWTSGTSFAMDGAIHPGDRFKLTYRTGETFKQGLARDGTEAISLPGWRSDSAFTVPQFGPRSTPATDNPLSVIVHSVWTYLVGLLVLLGAIWALVARRRRDEADPAPPATIGSTSDALGVSLGSPARAYTRGRGRS